MASERSGEIVVVGGGVVGLTTAVVLAERGRQVRVWTRDAVEATTSAVAGALWWPYRIEPVALAREWALRSLEMYEELAARPEAAGVRMVEGVLGETRLDEVDGWLAGRVPELRAATAGEYAGTGVHARLPLIDIAGSSSVAAAAVRGGGRGGRGSYGVLVRGGRRAGRGQLHGSGRAGAGAGSVRAVRARAVGGRGEPRDRHVARHHRRGRGVRVPVSAAGRARSRRYGGGGRVVA